MKRVAVITQDEFWAAVEAARAEVHIRGNRPRDGFTEREYSDKFKLNRRTARDELARLVKSGKFTRERFCFPNAMGQHVVQWLYRKT